MSDIPEGIDDEPDDDDGDTALVAWWCDTCATLMLLARAMRGECCVVPRHPDCPTPPHRRRHTPPSHEGQ